MNRRGVTLVELVLVLLVLGVALHLSLEPLRRQLDAIVLRSAREEVVALFHRARMEARLRGRSSLHFVEGEDPVLLATGRPPIPVSLRGRGVELEVAGSRSDVEIGYGPLGTASVASATLVLRRREAEARLVVSGYGRVRR